VAPHYIRGSASPIGKMMLTRGNREIPRNGRAEDANVRVTGALSVNKRQIEGRQTSRSISYLPGAFAPGRAAAQSDRPSSHRHCDKA
jgi:hypothetical protein